MNKRLQKKLDKLVEKGMRLELLRKKAGFILDIETKNCLVCDKKLWDEISFCCDEHKEYFLNCIIENKSVKIQVTSKLVIETKKYTEIDKIKKKYQQHLAPIPFTKKTVETIKVEETSITEQEAIIGTDETVIF